MRTQCCIAGGTSEKRQYVAHSCDIECLNETMLLAAQKCVHAYNRDLRCMQTTSIVVTG